MQPPGYPGGRPKPKDWALTGRGAAPVKPPWLVKQLPWFPPLTFRQSSDGVQMDLLGSFLFRVGYGSRLALFRIAHDELVAIAALLQVGRRVRPALQLPGAQPECKIHGHQPQNSALPFELEKVGKQHY